MMHKTTRGKLSEGERAYIAGIIDGEGCIGIHLSPDNRGVSRLYVLTIVVSNNNPNLCNFLQDRLGGSITKRQQKKEWNINYKWKVSISHAKDFLQQIIPYLILKKEQAILAIEFLDSKTNNALVKNGKLYSHPLTEKEITKRKGFYLRMKKLNQKYSKPKFHPTKLQPQRLSEETPEKVMR